MTVVRGARVTLRPFRADELPALVRIAGLLPEDDGTYLGPRDEAHLWEKITASGTWAHGIITFAVEDGGRLVGEIQARSSQVAMPPGVFELGVEIFDEADRGRGVGAAAVVEVARYLFDEQDAIRVQLSTDVGNLAMRRVAERLGFGAEGVLRGYMPTAEGPRDYVMFGLTKDDYEDVKTTWI